VALTVFLVPAAYVLVYGERGAGFGRFRLRRSH
jgi:hypothetical protein